uniref:PDZ domain-containing protein n=1 Tax=Caenorhabditis tropicalis TaxID=1561998 RepID=A0A1I7T7V5_9PELO
MSGVENNKDNKKQKSLTKHGSLMPNVSKPARSPRFKLKKKPSLVRNIEPVDTQRSDLQCSMDASEVDTKEEKTLSVRRSNTSIAVKVTPPEAPPTHFLPVTIEGVWSDFLNQIVVSRNMVITKVGLSLMDRFMPGDQISSINGLPLWSRDNLTELVNSFKKKVVMTMIVIRVWNMSCLTRDQIEKLVTPREEHLHYFSVRVYGHTRHELEWKLVFTKNRVLVQHIHADTPISSVLLIGDQILGINDNFFTVKTRKNAKSQALDELKKSINQKGFAEFEAFF